MTADDSLLAAERVDRYFRLRYPRPRAGYEIAGPPGYEIPVRHTAACRDEARDSPTPNANLAATARALPGEEGSTPWVTR